MPLSGYMYRQGTTLNSVQAAVEIGTSPAVLAMLGLVEIGTSPAVLSMLGLVEIDKMTKFPYNMYD